MTKHTHAFIRRDGMDLDAIGILTIHDGQPERSTREALFALEAAITEWVSETEEGKEAYLASSEDYNIGDFVDDYQSESFAPYLKKAGIEGLDLKTLCPDETQEYDRHLVYESDVKWLNDEND